MIKLRDVEKVYESGAGKTWVLRRINLDIAEGDFITIMGPSGAGKSTLDGHRRNARRRMERRVPPAR